jgi:UDP-glucose 4-epimerase
MILGFDPRYQFVHEDDVVSALEHVAEHELPGIYNVAADGVLAFTEVCSLLGKRYAPLLPPWGTGLALAPARRLGLRVPPEMLNQLRFGRGLDNRKLKASGFAYRYTSRETVLRFAEFLRLHPVLRGVREPYRYEREVEEFLRWSPSVRQAESEKLTPYQLAELEKLLSTYAGSAGIEREPRSAAQASATPPHGDELAEAVSAPAPAPVPEPEPEPAPPPEPPVEHYDDLEAEEILAVLGSLEPDDLATLREHESAGRARGVVLAAIDGLIARHEAASHN